jgi:hypothetical protein
MRNTQQFCSTIFKPKFIPIDRVTGRNKLTTPTPPSTRTALSSLVVQAGGTTTAKPTRPALLNLMMFRLGSLARSKLLPQTLSVSATALKFITRQNQLIVLWRLLDRQKHPVD